MMKVTVGVVHPCFGFAFERIVPDCRARIRFHSGCHEPSSILSWLESCTRGSLKSTMWLVYFFVDVLRRGLLPTLLSAVRCRERIDLWRPPARPAPKPRSP